MNSKLLDDFLKEQDKLSKGLVDMKPQAEVAHKGVMRLSGKKHTEENELSYEYILEKKPNAKKVIKFLQLAIDQIMEEADA